MGTARAIVTVKESREAAAEYAAGYVAALAAERAAAAGVCHLALCGGTTPRRLYHRLTRPPLAESVPWSRLEIFFGDERDVPQDHVENNYRMVASVLLDHVPVVPGQVHPMPADSPDLPAAAREYELLIRRLVPPAAGSDVPRLDLVLLGMGGEGHTASLFPDTPALAERERLVVAQFVPVIGRKRMTFTFPLINAARKVVFFVTGADKSGAVAAVLGEDAGRRGRFPAARVQPAGGELVFILDAAAAARLPG